ncbi:MAG: T9SS type A sorting domain-containing protein [Chitinophagaceae bacterium]|nr:MAG: T9SS type A sorting domain-containing protein [Chitinophagaceae bacterium]
MMSPHRSLRWHTLQNAVCVASARRSCRYRQPLKWRLCCPHPHSCPMLLYSVALQLFFTCTGCFLVLIRNFVRKAHTYTPMNRTFLLLSGLLATSTTWGQRKSGPALTPVLSPALHRALAQRQDSLTVMIQLDGDARPIAGRVLDAYAPAGAYRVRIAASDWTQLAASPQLRFADLDLAPREELSTGFLDLSLNRVNRAHMLFPSLRGDSVRLSIKEQAYDSTDIDLRGRSFHTGLEAPTVSAHAAIMATIAGGGGNSSPFAVGAAPSAVLSSASFSSLLPGPDSFYRRHGITVQNHSYGTAVQNYYGVEASAYDVAARNNPQLLFVFSAGNSGTAAATGGVYTGLAGVSNLTGNFKMAKNILVVGATDSLATLEALSSRGPASDGRVKPELVAFGQDGSSGAAALVSGSAALLQQAFRRAQGDVPPAALVKALLINSADDGGAPEVDYGYGYGSLNTAAALLGMTQQRYFYDSLGAGQVRSFAIPVPAGTARLRVTLAWSDPAAPANVPKALVNDLDALLRAPGAGGSWSPWVLNPAPSLAALAAPATRGVDTLNNVEQVTVNSPVAGSYSFEVRGSRVTGTQPFAVAWQLDTADRFAWTYPTANDPLQGGARTVLRWETGRTGNGSIEYSVDGTNWRPVAGPVPLAQRYMVWQSPDTTSPIRFRMRFASSPDALSDSTVVSPLLALQTGFNCTDSFLLLWNRGGASYRMYELGARYLQPFGQVPDTFAVLSKAQHPSLYYAVAPLIGGRPGLRSYTLKYDAQGVECYLRSFYLQAQEGRQVTFFGAIGTLYGVSGVGLQRQDGSGFTTVGTVSTPSATDFTLQDSGLRQGVTYYRLLLQLSNGSFVYSAPVPVYYFPGQPVLVFPNPVRAGQPVQVLSREAGRYEVLITDAIGRRWAAGTLNGTINRFPALVLPAGVYFIRITSEEGTVAVEKLVVL